APRSATLPASPWGGRKLRSGGSRPRAELSARPGRGTPHSPPMPGRSRPVARQSLFLLPSSRHHYAITQPVVAFCLKLQCQFGTAGFHDASVRENVDDIWLDVVQQALVVRHDQEGATRVAQLIHGLGDGFQRIDVEARVRLIEDREPGLEDRELQDLVALLFTARETFVDWTVHHRVVPAYRLELLFEKLQEVDRIELRFPPPPLPAY